MNSELVVIMVSVIGICVILPAFVVWTVSRRKMCEARERTAIAIAFLKNHPDADLEELVRKITPDNRLIGKFLPLLWVGIFFGIITVAFVSIAAVVEFASKQGLVFFYFLTLMSGALSIASIASCIILRREIRRH
ncbi:MAG: hypothetical protein ACI4UJ_09705 [Candidatus Cryptobacteroides sp.]